MAASYTYTCYIIDCSPSMGRPLNPSAGHDRTRLDYALDFVRVKLAQRLINPKKTDQIAIVLFGGKTDNALDRAGMKGYDHIEEVIPMRQPSYQDLQRLNHIQIGNDDTDIVSAIYVAGNLVRNCRALRKDRKKQVVVLTDAEEPIVKDDDGQVQVITTWNDEDWVRPLYEAVVPGLTGGQVDWKALFSLGVMWVACLASFLRDVGIDSNKTVRGMDFGEPDVDEHFESTWSGAQNANIDGIRALVNKLNDLASETGQARALLGSILSATAGASAPSIAPIKTVTKQTKLIIGDEDEFPGESLSFNVLVQKATQKASAKSMQKMRKGTWKKSLSDTTGINSLNGDKKKKRKRGSDDEDEAEEEDDDDRTTFHDPGALVPEKQWYYVPDYSKELKKPKLDDEGNPTNENEDEDEEDEIEKAKRLEENRRLSTDENLSRAYKYGSDLIPISKEESDFYTFPAGEPGLMVRGFIKTSQFHPEWALGDPYCIFGGDDTRSQLAFSGLLWAMQETKTIAVVRMLLPKITQPRIALLIPKVGEEAVDDRMEMGVLVPMPFKEEIANWSFPSLDRIHTVMGKPVTEHRLLPKNELLHSMDDFVDSMMLPEYSTEEEQPKAEGSEENENTKSGTSTTPWFDPVESYNPSIHNMRNCVITKLLNPSSTISEDTEVHAALTRYLFPPDETMEASAVPAMSLSKSAGLTLIPPKPKMARGRGRKKQAQKPSKTALEELLGEETNEGVDDEATQSTQQPWLAQSQRLYRHHAAFSDSQMQSQSQSQNTSPAGKGKNKATEAKDKVTKQKGGDDSSATEATDDEEEDADVKPDSAQDLDGSKKGHAKPSLLSYEDPIPDFEKLIKQGGMMTSTSMRQMCEMIPVFIQDAKTEKEMQKPRDCLVHARRAAIEEDESVLYNGLLHTIKDLLKKPAAKHASFLQRLKKENLGLVTRDESESHHGDPDALEGAVTREEANKFWK